MHFACRLWSVLLLSIWFVYFSLVKVFCQRLCHEFIFFEQLKVLAFGGTDYSLHLQISLFVLHVGHVGALKWMHVDYRGDLFYIIDFRLELSHILLQNLFPC